MRAHDFEKKTCTDKSFIINTAIFKKTKQKTRFVNFDFMVTLNTQILRNTKVLVVYALYARTSNIAFVKRYKVQINHFYLHSNFMGFRWSNLHLLNGKRLTSLPGHCCLTFDHLRINQKSY